MPQINTSTSSRHIILIPGQQFYCLYASGNKSLVITQPWMWPTFKIKHDYVFVSAINNWFTLDGTISLNGTVSLVTNLEIPKLFVFYLHCVCSLYATIQFCYRSLFRCVYMSSNTRMNMIITPIIIIAKL